MAEFTNFIVFRLGGSQTDRNLLSNSTNEAQTYSVRVGALDGVVRVNTPDGDQHMVGDGATWSSDVWFDANSEMTIDNLTNTVVIVGFAAIPA